MTTWPFGLSDNLGSYAWSLADHPDTAEHGDLSLTAALYDGEGNEKIERSIKASLKDSADAVAVIRPANSQDSAECSERNAQIGNCD